MMKDMLIGVAIAFVVFSIFIGCCGPEPVTQKEIAVTKKKADLSTHCPLCLTPMTEAEFQRRLKKGEKIRKLFEEARREVVDDMLQVSPPPAEGEDS